MVWWITNFVRVLQDLMWSIAAHFDLRDPTCIGVITGACIVVFVVIKVWTFASR